MDILGISSEPYVKLPNDSHFTNHTKDSEVVINQQRRQKQKFEFYLNTFDFLNDSQIRGDYLEFGCHKGRTFRMALAAAAFYRIDAISFHAFDSFQGLPDYGSIIIEQWKPGMLYTSEEDFLNIVRSLNLYKDKITSHKGFYDELLTDAKQAQMSHTRAAFICIDCDLYESAVSVFNFIDPFIQHGTVIYLDDVFAGFKQNSCGGVMEAFKQFAARSKFRYIEHLNVGWWGKSFIASSS
jgi:hypothetical protein